MADARAGRGLAVDDLAEALDGVYLDLAPIALDAGAQTPTTRGTLCSPLAEQRGVAGAELRGTLGADPIGLRARTGAAADLGLLARLAAGAAGFRELRLATVDAHRLPRRRRQRRAGARRRAPQSASPTCGR